MIRSVRSVMSAAALFVLVPALASAATDAEKCQAAKLKEAAKYSACRLKAEAKAAKTGAAPDFTKCDAKFAPKWTGAETKAGGACPVNGDGLAMQALITGHTDVVAAAIAGTASLDCGNGVVDAGEACDGSNLNGATCASEGFAFGVLSCTAGCALDTSGCWTERFVDNGDGTITDNQTGLMWEKKTELNSAINFANPHDADNTYRWAGTCSVATGKRCQPTAEGAALCAAHVEGNPDGCLECVGGDGVCNLVRTAWTLVADLNADSFAGYNDWRVPTREELATLVDISTSVPSISEPFHQVGCGAACTDVTNPACSCTKSNFYWTASSHAPASSNAWIVYFTDGPVTSAQKASSDGYVRAVRGGS